MVVEGIEEELAHDLVKSVSHGQLSLLKLLQTPKTDCSICSRPNIVRHQPPKISVTDGVDQCRPCCSELRAMTKDMFCGMPFATLTPIGDGEL